MNSIDFNENIIMVIKQIDSEVNKIKKDRDLNELSAQELEDLKELYVYINTNLENIVQNKQSELDDVKSRIKDKISNLKTLDKIRKNVYIFLKCNL